MEVSPEKLPQSRDAEYAAVGSVLLDADKLADVRGILRPDHFVDSRLGEIFKSALMLSDGGIAVDAITVREHLLSRGIFSEVGGVDILADVLNSVPSAAHAEHYAKLVVEKAKLRRLLQICGDIWQKCFTATNEPDLSSELASSLIEQAQEIRDNDFTESIRTLEQVLVSVIAAKSSHAVERYATGLTELDDLIGGLPIGQMTLVAGKAGMGKSILCKQMAINIARGGIRGGIITVEETAQKIGENYLAGASGISNNKIVYNRLTAEEMSEVVNAVPALAPIPLFIDDAQHKLSDIERTARRMVRKYGCKFLIVDHLHLIDGEYDGPREQEISRISGGLKKLFKDLGVAGIVAAQMNRGGDGDYESPPELRNLRGSGSLEQDGDLILQLHRQDYYDWKKLGNEFVADHRLRIFVNKNKHGAIGSRDAYFNGDHQTITNWNDGQGSLAHVAYPNIPSFEP